MDDVIEMLNSSGLISLNVLGGSGLIYCHVLHKSRRSINTQLS